MFERIDEPHSRSKKKGTGNGAVIRAKVRKAQSRLVRRTEEEFAAELLGITCAELRAIRHREADRYRPKGSTIVPRPTQKERQRLFLLQEEARRQSAGRGATP